MANKIIDFNSYGLLDENGNPLIEEGSKALANAVRTFLLTPKGRYVRKPNAGGILDNLYFKVQKFSTITEARRVKVDLEDAFGEILTINECSIELSPETQLLTVNITFTVIDTQEVENVYIYKQGNKTYNYTNEINYIPIEYSGELLVAWVLNELNNQPKQPILFNSDKGKWTWNNFVFVNLETKDDTLRELSGILNN